MKHTWRCHFCRNNCKILAKSRPICCPLTMRLIRWHLVKEQPAPEADAAAPAEESTTTTTTQEAAACL